MAKYIKHVEYDSLHKAISAYCYDHYCQECEIAKLDPRDCASKEFREKHHDEIVKILGLEVIEDV